MLKERGDGLYEDSCGRVFQEMVTVDVDLDAATARRLADLAARTGLSESQICEHAVAERLITEGLRGESEGQGTPAGR